MKNSNLVKNNSYEKCKLSSDNGHKSSLDHNWQKALESYNDSIVTSPESSIPYSNRGVVLAKMDLPEAASNDFSMAIKINPVNHLAYYNKALLLHNQQKHDSSIYHFDEAAKIALNSAETFYKLARDQQLVYSTGEGSCNKMALNYYATAIKEYEAGARSLQLAELLSVALEQQEQAKKFHQKLSECEKQIAQAYYNSGNILNESGEMAKAKQSYDEAIKHNPAHAEAYDNIIATLFHWPNHTEKVKEYTSSKNKGLENQSEIYIDYDSGFSLIDYPAIGETFPVWCDF